MASSSPVRVVSRHIVKPRPRPRECIPLTSWDVAMLLGNYIQKGLLFARAPFPTAELVDHLQATLADALATYYPVAGRFVTEQHRDDHGDVVGSTVSIDCGGQGVEIHHAVADGHSDRSQPRPRAGRQEVGKSRPRGCVARARARCRLVRKLNQTHISTLGLFASLPFGLCILVYTIPTNILGVGPPGLKGPVRPLLLHPPGPGLRAVDLKFSELLFKTILTTAFKVFS